MIILILHEHKKNRYYTRRIMGFHERPMDALSVTGKDISFQNGLYVHVWNGMSLGRSKPCLFCRSGTALNCQSGTILNCHSETILNCHSRTAIEAFKAFKAVQNLGVQNLALSSWGQMSEVLGGFIKLECIIHEWMSLLTSLFYMQFLCAGYSTIHLTQVFFYLITFKNK